MRARTLRRLSARTIVNGICLAAFRKTTSTEAMRDALASFDEDLADGRYVATDVLWRAAEISRAHTTTVGCRTLDVLDVATALELALRNFVTFDRGQQQLARAAGLKVVIPKAWIKSPWTSPGPFAAATACAASA